MKSKKKMKSQKKNEISKKKWKLKKNNEISKKIKSKKFQNSKIWGSR